MCDCFVCFGIVIHKLYCWWFEKWSTAGLIVYLCYVCSRFVIQELYDTEQAYVEDLSSIVDVSGNL